MEDIKSKIEILEMLGKLAKKIKQAETEENKNNDEEDSMKEIRSSEIPNMMEIYKFNLVQSLAKKNSEKSFAQYLSINTMAMALQLNIYKIFTLGTDTDIEVHKLLAQVEDCFHHYRKQIKIGLKDIREN